ncbi:N-acetylmuramoyl-L-alanine amidase [Candidatus Enterococcus clewellii]|uniref:N-acetylmuramoyl-L-alanine amidase n=1 Tax=Candidatus Enterococcus clewellii TaxID=1834193 RepID=A0A242K3S4_9ENTE|nr:N-acetylmuramoyl-L-alanine amidase [Enterococcus sp. 9E7_DIV0242]OTP13450.1 hypothetical protein A5888_002928 [Enterococcus sp. 9E7_DIV0242]
MVKILLISGHGQGDPGTRGNGLVEATETRDVVNRLAPLLKAKGADVTVLNQSINAFANIQSGSIPFARSYDYVFEVHFNSVENISAHGTEIYVTTSENSVAVEQKVMEKLSKFFTNRGVKRTNFTVIQTAKNMGMSSALLEVCFVSNASDAAKYKANKQAIAQAICDGIAEGFRLSGSLATVNNGNNNVNKAPVDGTVSGAGNPVKIDGSKSKAHLDRFGEKPKGKLYVAGWHTGNYKYEFIFIMDKNTKRELARVKAPGVNRPDVTKNGKAGFDVHFDINRFKGKTVYVMARCTNDASGNTAGGHSDIHFSEWFLKIQ